MWNDNIKTFLINTSDEIGRNRLPIALAELDKHNIPAVRYEAIKNNDGAYGLSRTMLKLFKENIGSQIIVFEDDIVILKDGFNDFNDYMEVIMAQLPKDFLCLYLGCNLLTTPVRVASNLLKTMAAYSSHAVIYSKNCIDLMLKLWEDDKPFDMFLMQKIQPYGKSFCTNPMLVSQRKGVSNIFNYDPKVNIGIERYYDAPTNEIDWGLFMKDQFELLTKNI